MHVSIGTLFITDGRFARLNATVSRWRQMVQMPMDRVVMVNDSGDPEYARLLESQFPDFEHVAHAQRRGFGEAINTGWDATDDIDWLLHMEDDFLINFELPVVDIITVLDTHPYLAQMALLRNPVNHLEIAAGGIVGQNPDDFHQTQWRQYKWLEHRRFYTTNPAILPHWTRERRMKPPQAEGHFGIELFQDPTVFCGYWEWNVEWVTHIGDTRTDGWLE